MLLPAITYAVLGTTGVIQYLRSEIIDSKSMDYVRTARSKGIPIRKVYTQTYISKFIITNCCFLWIHNYWTT